MLPRNSFAYKVRRTGQRWASRILPDTWLAKLYSLIVLHCPVDLNNPQTFNEKIQWMKINAYPKMENVIQCTDKYTVRDYVIKKGLGGILVPLYGHWSSADDIVWGALPNAFVLKCSHGCAYNIPVPSKEVLDRREATAQLRRWLNEDFGEYNIERHYSMIESRTITAEEYLGDRIIDYKFFCFNGRPLYVNVSYGLIDDRHAKMGFFDIEGARIPFSRNDYEAIEELDFPAFFPQMVEDARTLSKDFSFVRVDFFVVREKYYFAEMTFTPGGGMITFNPSVYDAEWGAQLDIAKEMQLYGRNSRIGK